MTEILTLTISKNPQPGGENRFVFDEGGGSIGRNPENHVVLLDPNHYLSRRHAHISYENGAFYLIDTSENGVFINHSNQAVGKNNKVRLNHGDCLGMGEYELDVSIAEREGISPAEPYQTGPEWSEPEPLGLGSPPPSVPWETAESQEGVPKILDGSGQSGLVPDYSSRDSQAARGAAGRQGGTESDHSAAEQDYFVPPSMQQESQSEESQSLDWDKTGFVPAAEGAPEKPDWDKTDFVAPARTEERREAGGTSGESTAAHMPAEPRQEVEPAPVTADVRSSEYRPDKAPRVPDTPIPEDAVVPPSAPSQARPITSAADVPPTGFQPGQAAPVPGVPEPEPVGSASPDRHGTSAAAEDALRAFFLGAGLQPEPLAPEAAEALMRLQGKLYREVVQGMMDLLRARFDLKNEIRARQTQVQIKENNPLKFIGQVDDALEYLVTKRSSGFLGPEAAFHEAFQDIKDHQVAMVVGMRAAFNSLLQRFDPVQLERKFTKGSKIESLLPMYRQAECWERYQTWFSEIMQAAEDDFQGLFGNEFARAYEDQMARLSLLRRKSEE